MIVYSSMIGIPLDWIEDYEVLKSALTVPNSQYYKQVNMGVKKISVPPSYTEYKESVVSDGTTYVWVPRFFDFDPYLNSQAESWNVEDLVPKLCKKKTPTFPFKGKLRLAQRTPHQILTSGTTGIVCMGCGLGKSVLAIKAATEMADNVLIVAHTTEILNQWKGYLLEFLDGITEDDIGWVQSNTFNWEKPFVLATLQTLALKDFPASDEHERFLGHYDLIIYDEVHRLGAEYFKRAVSMFAGNRWGLSATPKRRDSMDVLFRDHIGEVIHTDLSTPLKPTIYMLETTTDFDLDKFQNRWTGRLQYSSLDTALSEDADRNLYIADILRKLRANGRKVMVVGNRNNQLIDFWNELGGGLLIGNTKYKKERAVAHKHDLIFGAYKIVSEGLNIPELDTVLFVSHFSDRNLLQQIIGRALRKADNKKQPKIFYMWDKQIDPYRVMGYNFRRYCNQNGYHIEVPV